MELSTSTNILFERGDGNNIPAETSIRLCAQAGYRHMDFCFVDQVVSRSGFLVPGWRGFVTYHRNLAEKLGITFTQTHAPIYDFSRGEDPWQEELLHRSLEGSATLGAAWMVVHPSTLVTEGKLDPRTAEINAAFFRRLSDMAGPLGVGIAIENMWGRTREGVRRYAIQAEELLDLLDRIDAENVGICWDTEHGSIENLDQARAIRLLGSRIKATHISDQTGTNNIHILPYTGFTHWDTVLRAFSDIDYPGDFTYEIQHYLPQMPMEAVPDALRLSRTVGTHMIRQIQSFRSPKGRR